MYIWSIQLFLISLFSLLRSIKGEIYDSCSKTSFHIQSETLLKGEILLEKEVDSLNQCVQLCDIQKFPNCSGINFLLDVDDVPRCLLMDSNSKGNPSELPVGEHIIYSAKRFCVKAPISDLCPTRPWSFEMFPQKDVTDEKYVLHSEIVADVTQCLNICLNSESCLAAFYNRFSGLCRISVATLQAVYNARTFFHHDPNVDMYENNCVQQVDFMSSCNFLQLRSAGVIDHFDAREYAVEDVAACERECATRSQRDTVCRMYTFDSSTHNCYLNHATSKVLGRNPFQLQNKNLTTGEMDDCIEFALKCKPDALELHAISMKMFTGKLRTKKGKEIICEKNISSNFDFDLEIPYDRCGIHKQDHPIPSYTGLLFLKEGSTDLVTIRDKIIQVNCRMHSQLEIPSQTLSVHMQVKSGNNTEKHKGLILPAKSRKDSAKPKFSLQVMKGGNEAEKVLLGEKGHLIIKMNSENSLETSDFSVRNLLAQDASGKTKSIGLIDGDGCIINRSIITSISRSSAEEFDIEIQFSGFPHKSEVIYQALVEPCSFNCDPACNKDLMKETPRKQKPSRNRRSSVTLNGRQFEISQDVYKIQASRVNLLSPPTEKKTENRQRADDRVMLDNKSEMDVEVEQIPSESLNLSINRCLREDMSCLFTLLLACLQLLLLVSCVFIVYFYIRQWRSYRAAQREETPLSRNIQYEINANNQENK